MGVIGIALFCGGATLVSLPGGGSLAYGGWLLLVMGAVVALVALLRGPWRRRSRG